MMYVVPPVTGEVVTVTEFGAALESQRASRRPARALRVVHPVLGEDRAVEREDVRHRLRTTSRSG